MTKQAGQQLGDYRIIEPIGAGGMGEVYLAEHVHLRKKYAVKILPEGLAQDRDFVARFHDEARVMAELRHEHIVQVHHMAQSEGVYFLVMDYVTGPEGKPLSLHEHLKNQPDGRLPEAQVRKWAIQVAEALAYAHKRGVVHRDLKPANILIDPDGDAKLTDFGLAKAIGSEFILSQIHTTMQRSLGGRPTLRSPERDDALDTLDVAATIPERGSGGRRSSSASSILGTYDYMAPEQRGEGTGQIDQRTDIYSFGVVLYRLVTGERPAGMAKPPSQLVRGLSRQWDTLVARCLERQPSDRYASATELLNDLRAVGRSGRRRMLAIAAAVVLATVSIWAISWLGSSQPASNSIVPVVQQQDPSRSTRVGQSTTPSREVRDIPSVIEETPNVTADQASRARITALAAQRTARAADAQTHAPDQLAAAEKLLAEGEAHDTLTSFGDAVAKYDEANRVFGDAEQVARRITSEIDAFRQARQELEAAKSEASAIDAETWAKVRVGQARKFEEQAQETSNRVEAASLLQQATERFTLAIGETRQQGEAIIAAARGEALAAQDRARSGDGRKFASDVLGEAEELMRRAQGAGTDFVGARELYGQAAGKYDEAVEITQAALDKIEEHLSAARRIIADAGMKLDIAPATGDSQTEKTAAGRAAERLDSALAIDSENRAAATLRRKLEPWLTPSELALDLGGGVTMELLLIESGEFVMGSPPSEENRDDDEGPQHRVTFSKPFYLGKYEVTQAQWRAVMGSNPSHFKGDDHPVENVTWNNSQEFCRKLSERTGRTIRLPSEAEWEYASRAGTTTAYSFGDSARFWGDHAWYLENSGNETHPVGQKQANPWGLYDMHGNSWEWCNDWYGKGYYANSPGTNPNGPLSGEYRVLRGGSWDDANGCRCAYRYRSWPDFRYYSFGFRVVAETDTTADGPTNHEDGPRKPAIPVEAPADPQVTADNKVRVCAVLPVRDATSSTQREHLGTFIDQALLPELRGAELCTAVERSILARALETTGGNKTDACRQVGAELLIDGEYRYEEGMVGVHVRMVDIASGKVLQEAQWSGHVSGITDHMPVNITAALLDDTPPADSRPQEQRDLFATACRDLDDGKIDKAVEACTEILDAHPRNVETLVLRGHAELRKKGWTRLARKDFERALEIDQGNVAARLGLAQTMLSGDRRSAEKALPWLDDVLKKNPDNGEALVLAALVHERAQHLERAGDYAQRATEVLPGYGASWQLLTRLQLAGGESAAAVVSASAATKCEPQNAEAWLLLGDAQLACDQDTAAIRSFRNGLECQPAPVVKDKLDARLRNLD